MFLFKMKQLICIYLVPSFFFCSIYPHTQANRSQINYEPLSDSQLSEIDHQVRRYLDGTLDELDIVNIRQIQSVFGRFKKVVGQMEADVEVRLRAKYTVIDMSDPAAVAAAQKVR